MDILLSLWMESHRGVSSPKKRGGSRSAWWESERGGAERARAPQARSGPRGVGGMPPRENFENLALKGGFKGAQNELLEGRSGLVRKGGGRGYSKGGILTINPLEICHLC